MEYDQKAAVQKIVYMDVPTVATCCKIGIVRGCITTY